MSRFAMITMLGVAAAVALMAAVPAQAALTSGLQGYWPFDGDGDDAAGSVNLTGSGTTGFGSTSPIVGLYATATAQTGGTGVNSEFSGNAGNFNIDATNNEVTIAGWLRYEAGSAGGGEAKILAGLDSFRLNASVDVDAIGGQIYQYTGYVNTSDSTVVNSNDHGVTYDLNTWYHTVLKYESDGHVEFWLGDTGDADLSLVEEWDRSNYKMPNMQDHAKFFAAHWEYKATNPGGTINVDELALWNRALTDIEAQELFDMGKAGTAIIPEPSSILLLGIGGTVGLLVLRSRRRRA